METWPAGGSRIVETLTYLDRPRECPGTRGTWCPSGTCGRPPTPALARRAAPIRLSSWSEEHRAETPKALSERHVQERKECPRGELTLRRWQRERKSTAEEEEGGGAGGSGEAMRTARWEIRRRGLRRVESTGSSDLAQTAPLPPISFPTFPL